MIGGALFIITITIFVGIHPHHAYQDTHQAAPEVDYSGSWGRQAIHSQSGVLCNISCGNPDSKSYNNP